MREHEKLTEQQRAKKQEKRKRRELYEAAELEELEGYGGKYKDALNKMLRKVRRG